MSFQAHIDRRLELHYRDNLGLATYHFRGEIASHQACIKELGVWGRNRYPACSIGLGDLAPSTILHTIWNWQRIS